MISRKVAQEIIAEWRRKFEIRNDCVNKRFGSFKFNAFNEIEHTSKVLHIFDFMLDENGELPIPFASCNRILMCDCSKLKSFKNFPRHILNPGSNTWPRAFDSSSTYWAAIRDVTSLEGFPALDTGTADFQQFFNLDYSHADRHLAQSGIDCLLFASSYDGPLLSLLRIPSLSSVGSSSPVGSECQQLVSILNKHLAGERDIIDCQQELIDAGLKRYANL